MSDRDRRSAILVAIESGEISAEDGIARLAGLEGQTASARDLPSVVASPPAPQIPPAPSQPSMPPVPPVPPVPAMPAVRARTEHATLPGYGIPSAPKSAANSSAARWLRLRVRDRESGVERVKLNLPLSLVDAGLSMFSRLDPEGDWPRWRERFDSGEGFTLLEVDEPGGERVEITVD